MQDSMEELRKTSSSLISKPQLEDFPELLHLIQSFLKPTEAARTSILSKSWLQAWSTIPTLRFRFSNGKQQADNLMMIDRTLQRYLRDHIPFETVDLVIPINDEVSDSLAEKWIRPVATRACLKELSLALEVSVDAQYTLPGEIFSSENIRKIRISSIPTLNDSYPCIVSINNPIKCVSLRVLDLLHVNISEEVLDNLLSTCSLLEEVRLTYCKGLKTVKVRNLVYLCRLIVIEGKCGYNLEIHDVPNLSCFNYYSISQRYFHSLTKDSLASVTDLSLNGVIIDEAFLDMIKLKFGLLQNLTLTIEYWSSESFDITCLSLKTLSLSFKSSPILVKVQVFAPKLRNFKYDGMTIIMPSLVFPAITPEKIQVGLLDIDRPIDGLIFVKLREALMLPSTFEIHIWAEFDETSNNIDFDDLRRRFPFPATNLQHLWVGIRSRNSLLPFFDAFFSICHPKYVTTPKGFKDDNYICKLMIEEVMDQTNTRKGPNCWADYLHGVEIRNPHNGNWETLTDSSKSLIDNLAPYLVEFKLNWRS